MGFRKSHADASAGTAGDDATRRRRAGRGWGPFSGGQLTIIIVTFGVLLLLPVGAWAVSFSNVAITDPGGVNQAKVDGGKNLHAAVADPAGVNVAKVDAKNNLNTAVHDAVSGVAAKVNSLGQQLAAITGTVTVAYPTSAIVRGALTGTDDCGGGTCLKVIAPPAGKALVVTSIHVNTYNAATPGGGENVAFYRSSDGTCHLATLDLLMDRVNPGVVGVTLLQYDLPGGLTIPAGKALCALNSDPTHVGAEVTAWGYSVPSTAVPATAPAPGSPTGAALLKLQQ
jgi:hypothetical protein